MFMAFRGGPRRILWLVALFVALILIGAGLLRIA
jgi:hypothetical protein